jgi:hypothetical protein
MKKVACQNLSYCYPIRIGQVCVSSSVAAAGDDLTGYQPGGCVPDLLWDRWLR